MDDPPPGSVGDSTSTLRLARESAARGPAVALPPGQGLRLGPWARLTTVPRGRSGGRWRFGVARPGPDPGTAAPCPTSGCSAPGRGPGGSAASSLRAGAALAQKLLDATLEPAPLGLVRVHLSDLLISDPPAAVDQVDGGPVVVSELSPVDEAGIHQMGKVQAELACVGRDIVPAALVVELRRCKPPGAVPSRDLPDPGSGAHTVDSTKRPHEDENDLAPKRLPAHGLTHPA